MANSTIEIGRVFHALGDPTRRALVERLAAAPANVSALAELAGVTLTAIGQHLAILESAGLVATEKLGRVRTCRLETPGFQALETWISANKPEWEQKIARLAAFVDDSGSDWLG